MMCDCVKNTKCKVQIKEETIYTGCKEWQAKPGKFLRLGTEMKNGIACHLSEFSKLSKGTEVTAGDQKGCVTISGESIGTDGKQTFTITKA